LWAIFSGRIWTSQKAATPIIGAMISTTHEMALAIESSVSPWKSEASARGGSARKAKAMNGTRILQRHRHSRFVDWIARRWDSRFINCPLLLYKFRNSFCRDARAAAVGLRPFSASRKHNFSKAHHLDIGL
jgi:hypothetical protein